MSIAVVIPLYNGAPWIDDALSSVFAQDLPVDEVVVVDDGSTDHSPEIVRRRANVSLLCNDGKGSSMARNVGLAHTRSAFVAFLDQDDLWHPAHLRRLVDALERCPGANAAVAEASCFRDAPDYDMEPRSVDPIDPWTRFPFTVGIDGPSLALMRRTALEHAGGWDRRATGMGDPLMFLKLAVSHPLLRCNCRSVGKRIHASQQWLQVRELGDPYLRFRHDVMRLALDWRRGQEPDDPQLARHERHLGSLETLREIAAAVQSDRLETIPSLARALEDQVSDGPPAYPRQAFYCLMGALFKTFDAERLREERDAVFVKLLERWPAAAATTWTALASLIGEMPRVS